MDRKEIDKAAANMEPVFIVGAPRSGSSLLYRTLQLHPSFRCEKAEEGLNLQESDIVRHLPNLPWFNEERPRTLRQFMLGDDDRYRQFLELVQPLKPRAMRVRRWDQRLRRRTGGRVGLSRRFAPDAAVVRAFFVLAKAARGPERLVEKTPHHVEYLWVFRKAFQDARFLYIHRHPIDVFSSYRRRAQADPNAEWAQLTEPEFVELYGTMSVRAQAEARSGDLMLVPYEQFTIDPEDSFASVCEFLDEPFIESALQVEDPDMNRWKPDPLLFAQITPDTKDWSEYITDVEARRIETALREVMEGWGYRPYTDAW